ncbi:MAG: hypothetical protein PW845_16720 [Pseudomonas sp.]|uniref:hypothetical protein n=1 Tax=Pseudomonas abieticivorans TaxID=2931382 RepID=UPI0020BE181F|nr:hypothetical protein [Pseudomonas sp. PIA16]MDE1166968.1 hypothetical protein [Pseudomonas sp.]
MSHLISIDEATSARLVTDMDRQGFATLEHALTAEALKDLRAYVERQAAKHNNQYFAYHGYPALADSALATLGKSAEFKALMGHMHRLGCGHDASSDEIFPVLRCVQGGTGRKESNSFHYDATLLTMLIPIYTPHQGKDRGDLILFPNLRKMRTNVLTNIIEKMFFQNKLVRKVICWGIHRNLLKPITLRVVPGNVYFFWGYRSLHANQACDPAFRRATALFHYGDPHTGSLATRWILKLNQYRARKAMANSNTTAS